MNATCQRQYRMTIEGIPNSRTPVAWAQVNYRASATTSFRFHGAPRPRHGIARSARPGRRSHPPSQECRTSTYYHRNTTLPRLRSSRSAALTANGPPLAWRCRRRRHRDRWTPRRRFQVRSACPRGAADGPRPGQCPGTRGAGDSGRARRRRTVPVRPLSALPSSLLPSPPHDCSCHTPPQHPRRPAARMALPRRR